jgi:hypothetical protein
MTLTDFVRKYRKRYEARGPGTLLHAGPDLLLSALGRFGPVNARGLNVYEREWDVLLILDACRYDMYERVVGPSEHVWSIGSASQEWLANTFTPEYRDEMARTAYVTGNPYSRSLLDAADFGLLDEVWTYAWDDERGTIPAPQIRDRTVTVARGGEYDRVIAHFMQPHLPFIGGEHRMGRMDLDTFGDHDEPGGVWRDAEFARVDDERLWAAYDDNLRYVFEAVETILESVDGRVVVTADHGNAAGEWGMWGHRSGVPHPKLRRVPWDVRQATDTGEFEPETYDRPSGDVTVDTERRLADLGYL